MKKGEKTRLNIILAAGRLFAEKGYHKASIDDLAKELKMAKGTLYQYFDGKEGLLSAVLSWGRDRLMEEMVTVQKESGTIEDLVSGIVLQFSLFSYKFFDLFHILFSAFGFQESQNVEQFPIQMEINTKIAEMLQPFTRSLKQPVILREYSLHIFLLSEGVRIALHQGFLKEQKDVESAARRYAEVFLNGALVR